MKLFLSLLWGLSLVIAVVIGYAWGNGSKPTQSTEVLAANTTPSPVVATPTPQSVPSTNNSPSMIESSPTPLPSPTPNASACNKTGYAQKWEYLTGYIVKQGDTMQTIAKEQLKDETRVNEILQINGVGLVIGSTVYLPPPSITKSSGNIKQVYGKLMEKDTTSWHIGFSNDPKGQGILIPSFWFEGIANRDIYKIGDCLKVFFDDGFKVYTVALQ
jgi:LysM repeat protein